MINAVEALGDTESHVVVDDIRAGDELLDDAPALGPLAVHGDDALAFLAADERATTHHPHHARGFDLDHVGAHAGQHHAGEGAGEGPPEIEHTDVAESVALGLAGLHLRLHRGGFGGGCLCQHLGAGVLTQTGPGPLHLAGGALQLDGDTELGDRADLRVVESDDRVGLDELRVPHHFVHGHDGLGTQAVGGELGQDLRHRVNRL